MWCGARPRDVLQITPLTKPVINKRIKRKTQGRPMVYNLAVTIQPPCPWDLRDAYPSNSKWGRVGRQRRRKPWPSEFSVCQRVGLSLAAAGRPQAEGWPIRRLEPWPFIYLCPLSAVYYQAFEMALELFGEISPAVCSTVLTG